MDLPERLEAWTLFAEDPVACPADDLPDLPVLLTVVDGRVVHRAG